MTGIDEIIKEVALKNHQALRPDDPVMVLVTIVGRLAEDMAGEQKKMLDQYSSGLQELALDWRTQAKDTSDKVLNAALEASKTTMAKTMQGGAVRVVEVFDEHVTAGLAKLKAETAELRAVGRWMMLGGVLASVGGAAALAAALLVVLR